ncbi:MAG: anthranilate synthase component I family protein [Balneolaceae bacterium]|nr:anthranilate synthase component I family protein [Balneolaceae bacterium]
MNSFSIWPGLASYLTQAVESHEPFVLLDSWLEGDESPHGTSYLGLFPKEILSVDGSHAGNGLSLLANHVGSWGMGMMGYESHHHRFGLLVPPHGDPQVWWMIPTTVLRLDLHSRTIEVELDEEGRAQDVIEHLLAVSDEAGKSQREHFSAHTTQSLSKDWTSIDKAEYLTCIQEIKHAIYEGDTYEVNFTYPMQTSLDRHPIDWSVDILQKARVPFSALVNAVQTPGQTSPLDRFVLSASPERFLKLEGRTLTSEPIKGTLRRDETMSEKQLHEALKELDSEKHRAENLMIVDLVRHDFHAVCEPGSVVVPELFKKRSFGTVHQLVSTIQGTLPEGVGWIEAFEACFPMGSMTGAPKRAAMHLIDTLETEPRGIYSGAIGYCKPNGDADFNVVIRTVIMDLMSKNARYHVGGAITSDSDPQSEWDETKVKAQLVESG